MRIHEIGKDYQSFEKFISEFFIWGEGWNYDYTKGEVDLVDAPGFYISCC
jgi:hypothetical protein